MNREWATYITMFLIGVVIGFLFAGSMVEPVNAALRQWQLICTIGREVALCLII